MIFLIKKYLKDLLEWILGFYSFLVNKSRIVEQCSISDFLEEIYTFFDNIIKRIEDSVSG